MKNENASMLVCRRISPRTKVEQINKRSPISVCRDTCNDAPDWTGALFTRDLPATFMSWPQSITLGAEEDKKRVCKTAQALQPGGKSEVIPVCSR